MCRGEGGVTTETDTAIAKAHLGPPEAGRGRKHPPLEPSPTLWPPGENKFLVVVSHPVVIICHISHKKLQG